MFLAILLRKKLGNPNNVKKIKTGAAIMDKRTEYVEKLSAQMVEWEVQIERLKEKAESAPAEEKFIYAKTITDLQLKVDHAAEKLQGIAAATDDEWEDLKTGAEQIWKEVKDLLTKTIKESG